jgi:hypothetical protein
VVFESGGLSFVAEVRQQHLLPGLKVDVQKLYGREGVVAYSTHFEPGGC